MSKYVTKEIPVSPHIRKFLEYYFGTTYTFSKNDFLGKLIISVFRKGFRREEVIKSKDTYTVKILPRQLGLIGNHIEWSDAVYINKGVDDIFRNLLFFHIDMMRKTDKNNAFDTLLQSLYEFRITEEDINFDSLYRDYKRNCRYKKTNLRLIDLSLDLDQVSMR